MNDIFAGYGILRREKMDIAKLEPPETDPYIDRSPWAPKAPFRMLVCGPSGSGKTNMVANLICRYLHFDHLWFYSRHARQGKMKMLRQFFDQIRDCLVEESHGAIAPEEADLMTIGDSLEDVVPVDELPDAGQKLVVFDDFQTEKDQKVIEDYFVRGRHKRCSIIYLAQNYYQVPRPIRLNCSCVALFEVASGTEASMLCRELGLGLTRQEFMRMYTLATEEKYSFLFIDRNATDPVLKFRKRFDHLWWPAQFPPPKLPPPKNKDERGH